MDRQEYEKQLISRVLAELERFGLKSCAVSVILTGSFGRGEETIDFSDGGAVLRSDVEIAVVFRRGRKSETEKMIAEVVPLFDEELNLMTISERRVRKRHNFNYTVFEPKYKTIFTYDLYSGSKTIWGEDIIAKSEISAASIDKYEAWRLIANRIGEMCMAEDMGGECVRWRCKLLLADITAYLLVRGYYTPSFVKQKKEVLARRAELESVFGENIIRDYTKTVEFLREGGGQFDISEEILRNYTAAAAKYVENCGAKKPKVNCLMRKIKYFCKQLKNGFVYFGDAETHILQNLVEKYVKKDKSIAKTAELWHNIIY